MKLILLSSLSKYKYGILKHNFADLHVKEKWTCTMYCKQSLQQISPASTGAKESYLTAFLAKFVAQKQCKLIFLIQIIAGNQMNVRIM